LHHVGLHIILQVFKPWECGTKNLGHFNICPSNN
jgi:hypothetical protein